MKEYDSEKRKLYWQIAGLEHKLKQYKDIEDELGIDLITIFKAIKHGVFYKKYKIEYTDYPIICFNEEFVKFVLVLNDIMYYPQDYGKTWALTKGELE